MVVTMVALRGNQIITAQNALLLLKNILHSILFSPGVGVESNIMALRKFSKVPQIF